MSDFNWQAFIDYIIHPTGVFWMALVTTSVIAVTSMALGTVLGFLSCMAKLSKVAPLRWLSTTYVMVIRGTPLIVQIFFIYYGIKTFTGFDPFPTDIEMFGFSVSGAIVAGIVALGLNEGAYMSEIIRSGINAVPAGQLEAASSVGMSKSLAMRRIILPQAARIILPPFGNEFNGMIKGTSLVAFIGVYEIFFDAQVRYSISFEPAEYFAGIAVWYLALTGIWAGIQLLIERKLNHSDRAILSPLPAGGNEPVGLALDVQK